MWKQFGDERRKAMDKGVGEGETGLALEQRLNPSEEGFGSVAAVWRAPG